MRFRILFFLALLTTDSMRRRRQASAVVESARIRSDETLHRTGYATERAGHVGCKADRTRPAADTVTSAGTGTE